MKCPLKYGSSEIGMPYFDEKVHLCLGEITDYLICGDKLVLIYDEKRVAQFYSLDGKALFTYYFTFQNNGNSALYTDGKNLIVEDHRRNFYLFSEDGDLCEYIADENRKKALRENFVSTVKARTADDGGVYELRGASIYKNTNNKFHRIVARPFFMAIFQRGRAMIIAIVLALLLFVRYGFFRK